MKTITLICAILSSFVAISQTHTIQLVTRLADCAPVTQRIVQTTYSPQQREQLERDIRKLNKVNYLMAQSYRFADNQVVLRSQRQLFDLKLYEKYRLDDQTVTVFDSVTGLNVELLPRSEVDKQLLQIDLQCDIVLCD